MRRAPWLALALSGACSSPAAPPDPGNATFKFRESVEQIDVWKAPPGAVLQLERDGAAVTQGTTDSQGSFVFRKVTPGGGYVVRTGDEHTCSLTVMSVENSQPPDSFYAAQKLHAGFQYLTMRDGTQLSAFVTMPKSEDEGPFPTVANYSGYNASEPGYDVDSSYDYLCGDLPALCDAPHPDDSFFAALLGYATISVNIRGTGCSGGAYDYFETLQLLDGYDLVQITAAQDWVQFHKVGMVGLSYPGISQLFVAKTRPPGLAAILPLSVIGNTETTLVPGGILNDGFALEWVTNVLDKAAPYGQGWEQPRVDGGDTICQDNQLLHSQRVDNVQEARDMPYYVPEVVDPLDPEKWVDQINVPVFLGGAWQDEQTGPFFGTLLDRFSGAPALRFYVHNGVHPDQYAPSLFYEWTAFLSLFVAQQVPKIPPLIRTLAPQLFDQAYGAPLQLPAERFGAYSTHADALAAWMAEPSLHILFESGAGAPDYPGAPVETYERTFPAWPPAHTVKRWYFQPDGSLGDAAPSATFAASEFLHDPDAGERGILAPGGDCWDRLPDYDWQQPAAGSAVILETPTLAEDLMMAGTGSVDLWIRSTATEADLEVNLTEIRPDGQEMYVQSGWLRASQRKLAADATELYPDATHLQADVQPLVPGGWVAARVAIAPFAHVFRAGSRLRIGVDTPGDSRAEWKFALASVPAGTKVAVGHDVAHPSSLALPVLTGVTAPATLPPCTLRGQQCRTYQAYANVAASP